MSCHAILIIGQETFNIKYILYLKMSSGKILTFGFLISARQPDVCAFIVC